MPATWKPIRVAELELAEGIKPMGGLDGYAALYLLVRYQGQPIGWAWLGGLSGGEVPVSQLRAAISQQLGWEFVPLLLAGPPVAPPQVRAAGPISVVVQAGGRAADLEACLRALRALDYPTYEIIVIGGESLPGLSHPLVRYIDGGRGGLNEARNRAVVEAYHPIVAFVDAAGRPDRGWLQALAGAFADPIVMAASGPVAPARLESRAQIQFEFDYEERGRSFSRRVIRRDNLARLARKESKRDQHDHLWRGTLTPAELLSTHLFGSGYNMAFRRDVFSAVGLFDTAFDAIPGGYGGEMELFQRLVMAGYTLVYEPAALVWQVYPGDEAAFREEAFRRGQAFGAYLLACALNQANRRRSILGFAGQEWLLGRIAARLYRPGRLPRQIILRELAGALSGPFVYAAARRRLGRMRLRSEGPVIARSFDLSG
jgi:GT2 family glycosyltransferase